MGNIRPSFIKIRAIRLVEEFPDQFYPTEENPLCNCGELHRCAKCNFEMVFDVDREKCTAMIPNKKGDKHKQCAHKVFEKPYRRHPTAFDHNKAQVEQFTDLVDDEGRLANKRLRNWIAGYVTTYVQRRTD